MTDEPEVASENIASAVVKALTKEISDFQAVDFAEKVDDFIDTGSYALNWGICGRPLTGGWPGGRVSEVHGDPSTGKSILLYKAIARATYLGGWGVLDDTESSYMKEYGAHLGIDNSRLTPLESSSAEEHFEAMISARKKLRALLGPDRWIVMGLDSLANLSTRNEIAKGFDKVDHGMRAQLIKKGLRLFRESGLKTDPKCVYLVANHVIANIGDMFNPTTTPGGGGVPFNAAVRVELQPRQRTKVGDRIVGVASRFVITKNKVFPPYRFGKIHIRYDQGIVPNHDFYECAKAEGVAHECEARGWYRMDGVDKKFQQATFYEELVPTALKLVEERSYNNAYNSKEEAVIEGEEGEDSSKGGGE